MNFPFPRETNEVHPPAPPLKIPRLLSLDHKLQHAKDADGQPISLHDDLLFFLDDPPPGTRDRWQEGADLCEKHGIQTSRMSVWRFYRAHIIEWRREQAPPVPPPDPQEIARLHEQARHLAAQRALEMLNDPRLSPGHLIGLIQNDNHRQQVQLARDRFNDRLAVRRNLEQREHFQRLDDEARDEYLIPAQQNFYRKIVAALSAMPPGNGTSRCPPPGLYDGPAPSTPARPENGTSSGQPQSVAADRRAAERPAGAECSR